MDGSSNGRAALYKCTSKEILLEARGDVMIGQHGRLVHEALPRICGAKAIPASLLVIIIT